MEYGILLLLVLLGILSVVAACDPYIGSRRSRKYQRIADNAMRARDWVPFEQRRNLALLVYGFVQVGPCGHFAGTIASLYRKKWSQFYIKFALLSCESYGTRFQALEQADANFENAASYFADNDDFLHLCVQHAAVIDMFYGLCLSASADGSNPAGVTQTTISTLHNLSLQPERRERSLATA